MASAAAIFAYSSLILVSCAPTETTRLAASSADRSSRSCVSVLFRTSSCRFTSSEICFSYWRFCALMVSFSIWSACSACARHSSFALIRAARASRSVRSHKTSAAFFCACPSSSCFFLKFFSSISFAACHSLIFCFSAWISSFSFFILSICSCSSSFCFSSFSASSLIRSISFRELS